MSLARRDVARLFLNVSIIVLAATLSIAAAPEEEKEEGLPLEPTRTIEFSTSEVTWLSLDVSPDGKTLVLEVLGDLYTLPIEGGEATTLTSGMGFDSQPRYSPDGEWIAFLSDRDGAENVWIMKADGSDPRKLSQDESADFASPSWMPDGEYVIVSRSSWALGTYELWMYHVKGGGGIQVTKAKAAPTQPRNQRHNALGAVASPDGRYLYYSMKRGGFGYNVNFPLWQIARRDRITGDEDVLTEAIGSAIRPLLSPDGTKLVYGTRHDAKTGLRIRDLVTGEDRWLIYPITRDDQESIFSRDLLPGYAFMPGGSSIVLSYGGGIRKVDVGSGADTSIPLEVKVSQKLGPDLHFPRRVEEGPVRARLIQGPVLSPDGQSLAFSALTHLYVMSMPDGEPRRVTRTDTHEFQPAWSPDGRTLAYVTWSIEGGHLWSASADGTGIPRRLTRVPAFYADPAWSPDGERIVLLRGSAHERLERATDFGPPAGMDLVWVPAAGGDARLVIPARGVGRPHFGPEPDRIYAYLGGGLFGGGEHGLVSMRFDGTDRREHLKVTGPGIFFNEEPVGADDIRISPDGKWALAHVGNQLYMLAVPKVGGEAPEVNVGSPGVPLEKLTDIGADYFSWTDDGRAVTWAVGSTFYQRSLDSISFESKKEDASDKKDDGKKKKKKKDKAKAEAPEWEELGEAVTSVTVDLEVPRDVPEGTIVLRGADVITMRGDEVIRNADIVIEGRRIDAVGPAGSVEIPDGARVEDVSGKTIVPGFIDTHAHWFEIRRGVMDVHNWSFLANLAYGVTAGLDVQTATNDMFAYQDLVDAGVILGPRAYSTGPGIFSDNQFKSVEQAKGVISRYKEHYRTGNLKSYIVGNRKQRQFVAMASAELEMMPTTEGGLDLKMDLTHVLDGFTGNEHSLPIVPLYPDVVELVARSGIGYTPTLLVAYGGPWAENFFYTTEDVHDDAKLRRFVPHNVVDSKSRRVPWFHRDEHVFPKIAASAAKIARAGGHVGIGSHGQLQGLGYHWEMWALNSGGMTPLETLRAATLHGAEMIGYGQDLGSIEPGKIADLVVLDKNPLDDIRNTNTVRSVMKNGELFDASTLDQTWPERKELAPLWWWDAEP